MRKETDFNLDSAELNFSLSRTTAGRPEEPPALVLPEFLSALQSSIGARDRMAEEIKWRFNDKSTLFLQTLFPLDRLTDIDVFFDLLPENRPFLWVTDRPEEIYPAPLYYHVGTPRTLVNMARGCPLMGSSFLADRLDEGFYSSKRLQPFLLKALFQLIKGRDSNFSLGAVDLFAWFDSGETTDTYLSYFTARSRQSFGHINRFLNALRKLQDLSERTDDQTKKRSLAETIITYTGLRGTWAACAFKTITQDLDPNRLIQGLGERVNDLAELEKTFDQQFGPPDPLLDEVPLVFAIDPKQYPFAPVVFSTRPGTKLLPASKVGQHDIKHIWVAVDNPSSFNAVQKELARLGYPERIIEQRVPVQNGGNCMKNYTASYADPVILGERPPSVYEILNGRQTVWGSPMRQGLIAPLFDIRDLQDGNGLSLPVAPISGVLDERTALQQLLGATRSPDLISYPNKSFGIGSWLEMWPRPNPGLRKAKAGEDYSNLPARIV